MEMKYRGVEYNLDPVSLDRLESNQRDTDRGQGYNLPRFGQPPAPPPSLSSSDRGLHDQLPDQLKNSKPIPVPVQMQSPAVVRHPAQTDSATELHRRNILRSLQRRMQVARANGDRQLIQQLEQELQMFS